MRLTPTSIPNLQKYSANPDRYIVRASYTKHGVAVDLMKKGFFTWVKIHVGGALHLFDTTSLKMQHVYNIVMSENTFVEEEKDVPDFNNFLLDFQIQSKKYRDKHRNFLIPKALSQQDEVISRLVSEEKLEEIRREVKARIDKRCPNIVTEIKAEQLDKAFRIELISSKKFPKAFGELKGYKSVKILGDLFFRIGNCSDEVQEIFAFGHKHIYLDLKENFQNKQFFDVEISAE